MRVAYPGFLGASYTGQSPRADCELLVNFLLQKMESPGAKSQYILCPTPGLAALVDVVANVETRASFATGGRVFKVVGNGFYELFENGTFTLRGTLALDGNPATICSNGSGELFITSGGKGYLFDLSTAVFSIVLTSGATQGGALNAYFLAFDALTGLVRFSAPGDGTSWDPLDFFERSLASDPAKAMVVNNYGEAWLMGENTSEIWTLTGDLTNVFAPRQNLVIPFGILAPFSAVSDDNAMLWMSRNKSGAGVIVATNGYNPSVVSDAALSETLSALRLSAGRIDDAQAWGYEENNHLSYVLNLPTANITKVLDRTTGLWADRGTWNAALGRYDRWRANWHSYEWNKHIVGDSLSGSIFRLGSDLRNDADGRPIRRVRRAPAVFNQRQMMVHDAFEVYLEATPGVGEQPEAWLNVSDTGGKTWWAAGGRLAGGIGEYGIPMVWNALGRSADRAYELVTTDRVTITNAFLTLS